MQKRRALRIGGSVAGSPLALPPSGGRRGRMRQRPGRVPGMLGPPLKLAPRLTRHVAHVTGRNELRGTVQVRRRHHRRLLRLAAVPHFFRPRRMSNQHTRDHWVNIPPVPRRFPAIISPRCAFERRARSPPPLLCGSYFHVLFLLFVGTTNCEIPERGSSIFSAHIRPLISPPFLRRLFLSLLLLLLLYNIDSKIATVLLFFKLEITNRIR